LELFRRAELRTVANDCLCRNGDNGLSVTVVRCDVLASFQEAVCCVVFKPGVSSQAPRTLANFWQPVWVAGTGVGAPSA
jgi:hypothetical protein